MSADRRERLFELHAGLGLLARHEQLVREKLHRHREIEGAVLGIRRDADQHVTIIKIHGTQSVPLGTKQQGRTGVRAERDHALCRLARRHELPVVSTRPRRGTRDEGAVGDRLRDRIDHARASENVIRTRGQGIGFGVRKCTRPHQRQVAERHVLHGARDRSDVAGMTGIDEHHANESGHALLF